jgi:hypothetical protein
LERCAELLGVDLATIGEAAANVEPYLCADGTRIWSLMQLERQLRPEAYGRRLPRPSTNGAVAPTALSIGLARMTDTSRTSNGPCQHPRTS